MLRRASKILIPIGLLIAWDLSVRFNLLVPSQSAAPMDVLAALGSLLASGTLFVHSAYSLGRLCAGVLLGSVSAVLFCLAVVLFRRFSDLFVPSVQLLAGVPVVLWMPFCVMFLGTEEAYKVSLVAIATFFLVQFFVLQSFRSTQRQFLELVDLYEQAAIVRVRHVLLPGSLPAVLTAIRAAFAGGWVILFFVEFATSKLGHEGLGWFIGNARNTGRIEEEFAALLWLAILAFAVDVAITSFQRRRVQWVDARDDGSVAAAQ